EMLLFDKEQKNMVQRISLSVRQSLNLNDILNTTVKELGENLQASRCCLALLDTHGTIASYDDELIFDYVWHDEIRGGDALGTRCVPITGNSVLKTILDQGSIMSLDIIDDKSKPIFGDDRLAADDWKSIRSLIACPISTKQGILGMILVHQCDKRRIWSPSELELVEAVAGQVTVAMEHARLYDRTKRMAEQEMLINHIVRSVRGSLDLDTILNTVTRELLHALRVDRVQIIQPRSEDPLVVTHEFTVHGYEKCVDLCMYPENMDFSPSERRRRPSGIRNTVLGINLEGLLESNDNDEAPEKEAALLDQATTMHEAPIAVISDVGKDSRCIPFKDFLDTSNSRALIAAPLLHENRLTGLLIVHQCASTREWLASDVQLVTSIANQLAIAVTHAQLYAQVRHQAITDGLTSLYNHVYFKNRLEEELRLADRKGTSCSLIMIDLDKLKDINDNYGHPIGDAAIRQVASILKTVLRSGDTAARYGGEEFAVILPETSLMEAALIADRLCTRIRNAQVPGLGQVTASLGASSYPKQASTPEELISNADKALYQSKHGGRDQARIFEAPDANELPTTHISADNSADIASNQTTFAPDEARSQPHQ
ncbi:MAG: sensor domain-containing diguanylate cyclase, partial [Candidatus Obscuribacterales bacterium]|nr:sensor domain-containing diguanylate cyclase [Candidatus Obscuribacterales bacterium]